MLLYKDSEIKELLEKTKRIAVVGLSEKPDRDSYRVAQYLQNNGYEIIPVNPSVDSVLGVPAVASLQEIEGPIDMVDVFRRSEHTPEVVREAVEAGAKSVWLQLGIHNEESVSIANQAGIPIVTNLCIKVEHMNLLR